MLSAILSAIGGQFIDRILGGVLDLAQKYIAKQITMEQLKTQLLSLMVSSARDIEIAHADALTKTYAEFQQTMRSSVLVQAIWASVVISQTIVLVWHQLGIPALCYFVGNAKCYPSSGATVEWAYLLLAGLMGMAPVVLRSGPGAGNIAGTLKSLVR